MIRLLAVRESPNVATRAANPITIPKIVIAHASADLRFHIFDGCVEFFFVFAKLFLARDRALTCCIVTRYPPPPQADRKMSQKMLRKKQTSYTVYVFFCFMIFSFFSYFFFLAT